MPTEERVLCFNRQLLEELGVFQGLSLDVEKYLPVVTAPSQITYLNRSEAEQDRRVAVRVERHYQLVAPELLTAEDLASYRISADTE